MRDIEFRGQRKDGKGWVSGWYVVENRKHWIVEVSGKWNEIIPETVGQFIGRKDKNGKDIHEGDRVSTGFWCGTVEFKEGAFKIVKNGCSDSSNFDVTKVIGNIHESTNLLYT